jgi:hypothetical protein
MANSRFHWRVKENKRKAYFESCDLLAIINRRSLPDRPQSAHVRLRATIYCGGHMDADNALSRLKWPTDWLVRHGYLRGDREKDITWVWPIEQVVKRNHQYRVEFELSPTTATRESVA